MEKNLLDKRIRKTLFVRFLKEKTRLKKKWEKSGIKISKNLRDIIHGYIMSDGYLRNGILTIEQSAKQKRFVLWLYDKLKPIRTSSPIKEVLRSRFNLPNAQVKTRSFRFFTQTFLEGFQSMWYEIITDENGIPRLKKKLPKNIACFFNETFISVWYAGDGTKIIGSVGARFDVTCFTVEERLKLKALFLTHFDIQTQIISSGISKKGNTQWALKIPAKEYQKFRNLITKLDLISTIFPYKLHKKE